jgi:hypothetical protein
MKRQKDLTPHTCQLCQQTLPASGMGSHLYHKHEKMTSQEYVEKFTEFRQKYIKKEQVASKEFECKECGFLATSSKHLMHHIQKEHPTWEEYIVKHFYKGEWPTCQCGCGERVKLLRQGKNEQKEVTYARKYIQGHDTRLRKLGYRANTLEQRQNMRESAIKRMQESNTTFHQSGPSKAEQEILEYIKTLGVEVRNSDRELLKGLEVDILIPSHNLAIEYNGSYFHSDLFKDRYYHLKKSKELQEKGIRLMHVWESDWYLNSNIIKSMIAHSCHKTENIIYARNTEIKVINSRECNQFLQENHLQGSAIGAVYLGLFYKDKLVQVMSFSKLRAATGLKHIEGSYELLRTATILNTGVIGGASKLFKFFIKNYNPEYILSYANRDWSSGTLYNSIGLSYVGETPPGYFYVKSRIKYSRFQFQKHKLVEQGANPEMTEYEIMRERGFARIWDCGNLKFEWKKEDE